MECPEEQVLADHLAGELSGEAEQELQAHLRSCLRCAEALRLTEALRADLPPSLPDRGISVGRYLIVDVLGAGGMGVVYDAYDPHLERRVAIKVVASSATTQGRDARERCLREARALGRLVHPNVVAIFDAGPLGDNAFLVMERLAGKTLRRWLAEQPRSTREILRVFADAARGLAAAHAAGIVHRDFKPDNVMVGADGRARVTDFGLARLDEPGSRDLPSAPSPRSSSPELPSSADAAPSPPEGSPALATTHLPAPDTSPSERSHPAGTPGYAAPEQLQGLGVDARADQYSFCAALSQALSAASSVSPQGTPGSISVGTTPSRPRRLPSRLRKVLQRGLSADPTARHPTMAPLLRALDPPVHRWWVRATALLLVSLGLALALGLRARDELCSGAERYLDGVWDPVRRRSVQRAFLDTRLPFAANTWRSVALILDHYALAWIDLRKQACRSSRILGTDSDELLSLRNTCLDRRLVELRALTRIFDRADAQVVEHAVEVASSLRPVRACRDASPAAPLPHPLASGPADARLQALERQVAELQALERAGRHEAGLALVAPAIATARGLGNRPLLAEVQFWRGRLLIQRGEMQAARRALFDAVSAAEASRHDELAAEGWIALTNLLSSDSGSFAQADAARERARAATDRVGGPASLRARLLDAEGMLLYAQGRYAEGASKLTAALALVSAPGRGASLGRALFRAHLGVTLRHGGRLDEARQMLAASLHERQSLLGSSHPLVARTRTQLALVERDRGAHAEAEAQLRRALSVQEQVLGSEHWEVGVTLAALASVQSWRGQHRDALASATQALRIAERSFGEEDRYVAEALTELGRIQLALGEPAAAHRSLGRAHGILVDHLGADHPRTLQTLQFLEGAAQPRTERQRAGKGGPERGPASRGPRPKAGSVRGSAPTR